MPLASSEEIPDAEGWTPRNSADQAPRSPSHAEQKFSRETSEKDAAGTPLSTLGFLLKAAALVFALIISPVLCRRAGLESSERCAVIIVAVLLLNIAEVMPLFCTALFIPVLGSLCAVLGAKRDMVATSTLLVGNVFNSTSFMVLGALVINGIFEKCQLGHRLMSCLVSRYAVDGPMFLLLLMLGGMALCSVLYSGSLMLLAALRPLIFASESTNISPNAVKRLILAIAFASNIGSTWLPISSPVNLITVSLLDEFDSDHGISVPTWARVAIPVTTLALLCLWLLLLGLFPTGEASPPSPGVAATSTSGGSAKEAPATSADLQAELRTKLGSTQELTRSHYAFIAVALLAVLGMTALADDLEPLVGHPACISLGVVVLAFGSGFMSRAEFLQLDWDLLALVGGTNVMAFLVRETGLGAKLSALLVGSKFFTSLPYWGMLACIIIVTLAVATVVGHTLTGVLLLPLVVALGVKLQAAEITALLCAIAIPLGFGLPFSSFDNLAAYATSRSMNRQRYELTQRDFAVVGGPFAVIAAAIILSFGFYVSVDQYGLPPPVVVSETIETPKNLRPKVTTENLPPEAQQLTYTKAMADWDVFLSKPDHKAFAVGELKDGMRTRPWGASWGHANQKDAEEMAVAQCEKGRSSRCRIIYPPSGSDGNETAADAALEALTPSEDREDRGGDGGDDVSRRPNATVDKKNESAAPAPIKLLDGRGGVSGQSLLLAVARLAKRKSVAAPSRGPPS